MLINITIIEDNAHMQQRLTTLLDTTDDIRICGIVPRPEVCDCGRTARDARYGGVRSHAAGRSGTEAIRAMQVKYPQARIVMYTAYENESDIIDCMLAGAAGYILKDTPDDRLLAELRVVAQGGSTLTPRVAEKLLKQLAPAKIEDSQLSKRELEVLNFISLGLKYEDIADELDISVHTVRHHIEKIYKKLGVNSRGQAVAQAVRSGVLRFGLKQCMAPFLASG